jgi:hypothetical protein
MVQLAVPFASLLILLATINIAYTLGMLKVVWVFFPFFFFFETAPRFSLVRSGCGVPCGLSFAGGYKNPSQKTKKRDFFGDI